MDALQLPRQVQSIGSDQELSYAVLDPLFSGFPESVFQADPHAGNLMVQTQKNVLRSRWCFWTGAGAGRLSAPLCHALLALCLYCVTGDEPSPDVLTRATRE